MMTFPVLALLREDGRPLIQQTEKVVLGTHAGLAFKLEMAVSVGKGGGGCCEWEVIKRRFARDNLQDMDFLGPGELLGCPERTNGSVHAQKVTRTASHQRQERWSL